MRSIFVSFLSLSLLGLVVGCGGSDKVVMPAHLCRSPRTCIQRQRSLAAAPARPRSTRRRQKRLRRTSRGISDLKFQI